METVLPYVLANEHWKIERLPIKRAHKRIPGPRKSLVCMGR